MPSAKKRKAREHEVRMQQLRLWGIVGGIVVLLAIAAIVLSQGSGDQPVDGAAETRPVAIAGDPLTALPTSGTDPAIGMPAPTITGESFDGSPVTIDPGSTGEPMAIWFVAHWCEHCRAEVPRIVSVQGQGLLPAGVDVYAVSTGVNASAPNYPPSAWLSTEGWPFPVLADDADGTAGQAYGLGSFPYLVLIDAEGNVVARHSGELGEDGIVSALQQLTAG
ncbi:MAG TPA: redoxin family protein [Actinomycetota bacterium]|nr:redoxin family protein [Actinomycetota bacterium]